MDVSVCLCALNFDMPATRYVRVEAYRQKLKKSHEHDKTNKKKQGESMQNWSGHTYLGRF